MKKIGLFSILLMCFIIPTTIQFPLLKTIEVNLENIFESPSKYLSSYKLEKHSNKEKQKNEQQNDDKIDEEKIEYTVLQIATVFTNGPTNADTNYINFSQNNSKIKNQVNLGQDNQVLFDESLTSNGERMMFSLGSFLSNEKYTNLMKKIDIDTLKIFSSEFTHSLKGARAFEIGATGFDKERYIITKDEKKSKDNNNEKSYLFPPFEFNSQLELTEDQPEYEHALPYGLLPSNIQNFNISSDKMFFSNFEQSCPQLAPSYINNQLIYLAETKE